MGEEIFLELNDADAIVCQISRHFLASDFCVREELGLAAKRQEAGEAALIGYLLHECDWKQVDNLRKFQIIPHDARSKDHVSWRNQNRYWQAVTEGIRLSLKKLQENPGFRAKRARERRLSKGGR